MHIDHLNIADENDKYLNRERLPSIYLLLTVFELSPSSAMGRGCVKTPGSFTG